VLSKKKRRPYVLNSAGIFSFMFPASLKSTLVVCFYEGPDDKRIHVLKCQNRITTNTETLHATASLLWEHNKAPRD
jgi:hypothetical protein